MTVLSVRLTGAQETAQALEKLARESPVRARRAVNRTIGVARQRVIKSLSRLTGVSRTVLGGRKGRRTRAGGRVKGKGYIKQVKASRHRSEGALVALVEGVRFSRLRRKTPGRLRFKPGGVGQPFRASVASGHESLFRRHLPATRVSRGASAGTQRRNLPIRELVIPLEPHASRVLRIIMARVSRTVYPDKVWEELRKSITPVR